MPTTHTYLDQVGRLTARLKGLGLHPVLIGGMALVILGSRRVTRDFDFLISLHDTPLEAVISLFYEGGFELASRVNDEGEILRTIDNPRVATARIRIDASSRVYFLHTTTRLRVDLLLDFPIPAARVAMNAEQITIAGHHFWVASRRDLLKLKQIAYRNRRTATDRADIEFLQKRGRKRK